MEVVAKILAKKALRDVKQKNTNSTNPYEEMVPVHDRRGRPTGKVKKQKRRLPDGLSENDQTVLKKIRRRAYRLDMSLFNCCGIRFGWSSVVGIVPVIGDFIDCFLALMLVKSCGAIDGGLPQALRARMLFNIALDFGIGLVPIIGDLADAIYRANSRNAWLLESYLSKKVEAQRRGVVEDEKLGTVQVPTRPSAVRQASSAIRTGILGGRGRTSPPDEEMGLPPTYSQPMPEGHRGS